MLKNIPYIYKYDTKENDYYIMRDDLLPFSFGGNKVRKNLYFFEDITFGEYTHVVTYGSKHSNHARIVANFSTKHNLKCTIITPMGDESLTYNYNINQMLNAQVIYTPIEEVKKTIKKVMTSLEEKGEKPYFIEGGGHGYLGTKAYVDAYKYINDFSSFKNISFDYIFLATGTGATQAGLIIGNYLNNKNTKIIGVSVARSTERGSKVIRESINEYIENNDIRNLIFDINFCDHYLAGGYGSYNSDIESIIEYYTRNFGIPLDPIYTGKAVYGMHDFLEVNDIKNKKILFIHTGGTPLFFDFI